MKEQLLALYGLQGMDVQIAKLNAQLAALTGGKELRQKLAAAKAMLAEGEKALTGFETELKDSELKLKSVDDKRTNFEKRLYGGSVSNPKELGSIEKEIKMLKDQQSKLDERTLELYDMVEAARQKARAAGETAEKIEKRLRDDLAQESSEKARLESEIADMTAMRESAIARITEKSLISRYTNVRKHSGGTGIAKVVDGKCEGCHVSVTMFTIRNLIQDKEMQLCESCGRILMLDVE